MFDTCLKKQNKTMNQHVDFQEAKQKAKNSFRPLFIGVKSISHDFKVEREMGIEPTTFSLGS